VGGCHVCVRAQGCLLAQVLVVEAGGRQHTHTNTCCTGVLCSSHPSSPLSGLECAVQVLVWQDLGRCGWFPSAAAVRCGLQHADVAGQRHCEQSAHAPVNGRWMHSTACTAWPLLLAGARCTAQASAGARRAPPPFHSRAQHTLPQGEVDQHHNVFDPAARLTGAASALRPWFWMACDAHCVCCSSCGRDTTGMGAWAPRLLQQQQQQQVMWLLCKAGGLCAACWLAAAGAAGWSLQQQQQQQGGPCSSSSSSRVIPAAAAAAAAGVSAGGGSQLAAPDAPLVALGATQPPLRLGAVCSCCCPGVAPCHLPACMQEPWLAAAQPWPCTRLHAAGVNCCAWQLAACMLACMTRGRQQRCLLTCSVMCCTWPHACLLA
jgi:hypothetical protein